jgi:His/Glu/Gln/Arg/opine family amino acid ABC transporter permease subunit
MTIALLQTDLLSALPLLTTGLGNTLQLILYSGLSALILGSLWGILAQEAPVSFIRQLARLLGAAVRGMPLPLFLIGVHYGLMPLWTPQPDFLLSAWVVFTLFEAAFVSELVRGGLLAVHTSERESAILLGLNPFQQYVHVILPLAFSRAVPALSNQAASLIKDTSVASILGLMELTRAGEVVIERTHHELPILVLQLLVYLLLCTLVTRWIGTLQAKATAV